jgi:hypothetical protein
MIQLIFDFFQQALDRVMTFMRRVLNQERGGIAIEDMPEDKPKTI